MGKEEEILILSSAYDAGDAYDDINKAVQNVRLLIWTPSCMAGISIKKKFDRLFCSFSNMSAGVNASSQMMLRVRKYNTDDVHIFVSTKTSNVSIGPTTWRDYVATNTCLIRGVAEIHGKDMLGTWKYNSMGQVVYDTNDPYYRLKAHTDIRRNLDKLHWVKIFIDHETEAGVKFIHNKGNSQHSKDQLTHHKKYLYMNLEKISFFGFVEFRSH